MPDYDIFKLPLPVSGLKSDALDYLWDAGQKSILFLDVLRQRGNIYMEHLNKGKPPVLTFDYKIIMDGRKLKRPVNHDLIQIIPEEGMVVDSGERPIVIIDPPGRSWSRNRRVQAGFRDRYVHESRAPGLFHHVLSRTLPGTAL